MMDALLAQVEALHRATPALSGFGNWPSDLQVAHKAPVPCPATALIDALPNDHPLTAAIKAAAPFAEWRRTYSADEVGQDFLNRYGYFELFGPHGHFRSRQLRGYIAFWDAGLDYGWHHHTAEQLYFSLQGEPLFTSKSKPDATIAPGETRHHAPWEVHGMQTLDTPFLCYALWKGPGLADLPQMSA